MLHPFISSKQFAAAKYTLMILQPQGKSVLATCLQESILFAEYCQTKQQRQASDHSTQSTHKSYVLVCMLLPAIQQQGTCDMHVHKHTITTSLRCHPCLDDLFVTDRIGMVCQPQHYCQHHISHNSSRHHKQVLRAHLHAIHTDD